MEACCIGNSCLKQTSFKALVDSGTSFTFLPEAVYDKISKEVHLFIRFQYLSLLSAYLVGWYLFRSLIVWQTGKCDNHQLCRISLEVLLQYKVNFHEIIGWPHFPQLWCLYLMPLFWWFFLEQFSRSSQSAFCDAYVCGKQQLCGTWSCLSDKW